MSDASSSQLRRKKKKEKKRRERENERMVGDGPTVSYAVMPSTILN